MKKLFYVILFCSFFSNAQVDFDNYVELKAQGPIPIDFALSLHQKIVKDSASNVYNDEDFNAITNYSLNEILHSGRVVYGDPISEYVKSVGKVVLKNDIETYNKLSFYTIRSRASNAFCTSGGKIFVTTGLISRLSDEAQLAGILGHEITHFTENHVKKQFNYDVLLNSSKSFKKSDEKIIKLSTFSKESEFEADEKGFALALDAGYSKKSIFNCFDVLLYSELAFDTIMFDTTFYNSPLMQITGRFANRENQVYVNENYNDSRSSHPNIRSRKERFSSEILNKYSAGSKFIFSESNFTEIKNIAQFESLRLSILEKDYISAIYEHFLLKNKFGNSNYLSESLCKIWYSLGSIASSDQIAYQLVPGAFPGAEYHVAYFLDHLNPKEQKALALRILEDERKKFPESTLIMTLQQKLYWKIKRDYHFSFYDFSKIPYNDSLAKSEVNNVNFWLSDYKSDDSLKAFLNKKHLLYESEIPTFKERLMNLTYDERQLIQRKGMALGLERILVLEPIMDFDHISIESKSDVSNMVDERNIYINAMNECVLNLEDATIQFQGISSAKTTEEYNRNCFLNEFVSEVVDEYSEETESLLSIVGNANLKGLTEKYDYLYVPIISSEANYKYNTLRADFKKKNSYTNNVVSLVFEISTGKLVYINGYSYPGISSKKFILKPLKSQFREVTSSYKK